MKVKQTKNALLLLLLFVWAGCTQELDRGLKSEPTTEIRSYQEEEDTSEESNLRSGTTPQLEGSYRLTKEDFEVLKRSYDDFKTLALETRALQAKPLDYSSFSDVPISEILENPIVAHLQFLDIEDADTHEKIKFYDFPLEEREEFLNCFLKEEQRMLAEKVAVLPELLEELKNLNTVHDAVFREEGISRLDIERKYLSNPSAQPKRHTILTPSALKKDLFTLVEEELERQTEGTSSVVEPLGDEGQPSLRSSGGQGGKTISPPERIIEQHLRIGANRGDILMYEPHLWLGRRHSKGGHTAIIDKPVHGGTKYWDDFSIDSTPKNKKEGHSNGVQKIKFRAWCRPHYVLGLQRITSVWGRRRSGWREQPAIRMIIVRPIADLSPMADRATRYIGRPYGSIFWSMKEAPQKFICSSLVWYCAKEEYGLDISNGSWFSVWPRDILESPYTYIKGGKRIE